MRGLSRRPLIAPAAAILGIFHTITGCGASAEATPPPQAVTQKAAPRTPVMMVIGDSFTVGSGPVRPWETYATGAARLLGWQPVIAGAGGTGYVNPGRVGRDFERSFQEELSWRPAPDLLVVSGGHNDHRWTPHQVRQAAARLVWTVRSHWPSTRIVIVGPIWLDQAPPKAYAIRDALAGVAAQDRLTFLDPMSQRWVTGRRSEVVLPDGTHPTFQGHTALARWLAGSLRRLPVYS